MAAGNIVLSAVCTKYLFNGDNVVSRARERIPRISHNQTKRHKYICKAMFIAVSEEKVEHASGICKSVVEHRAIGVRTSWLLIWSKAYGKLSQVNYGGNRCSLNCQFAGAYPKFPGPYVPPLAVTPHISPRRRNSLCT
ncbi:hypothetical protein CBL_08123 [Carabus blaptoides fortunei]